MEKFDKNVPFDPGYSKISFSFMEQVSYVSAFYEQVKTPHQKKFQLTKLEPAILDLVNQSTAFYLGCMLWGGFIHQRFIDEPKEITGNHTKKLSEKEAQEFDCGEEPKMILNFIENLNRDCKYYLKRPAKVPSFVSEVLNSYIEFAKINGNFINVEKTSDIKLPNAMEHFKNLDNKKLDELCDKIYSTIDSGKIEKLLELGFYKA